MNADEFSGPNGENGRTRDSDDLNESAPDVARLVRRAADGDGRAWDRLVDRYSTLIWTVTRSYQLAESDARDVAQATWLRLLEHIHRLEDPARLGSWLAATARNECLLGVTAREKKGDVANEPEVDERLLDAERNQSIRDALSRLPLRDQRLLRMLMSDPPASYAEISDKLGLPIGSIGPARGRALERLRVLFASQDLPLADSLTLGSDGAHQRQPAAQPAPGQHEDADERRARRVALAAGRLLTAAGWLLPATGRARYCEEYRYELWEIASNGGRRRHQLLYAIRQLTRAARMRHEVLSPRRRNASP